MESNKTKNQESIRSELHCVVIKPCPFCKSIMIEDGMGITELSFEYGGHGPPPMYSLRCEECGCVGPSGLGRCRDDHYGAKEQAIVAWNDRAL